MVLFWWPLPVSTEAGGGLGLVLVWCATAEVLMETGGASS